MLTIGNRLSESEFKTKYEEYYTHKDKYYNDKNLWGLETLYYALTLEQENDDKVYTEKEIIGMVNELVVMEAVDLYEIVFEKHYYGKLGTDIIETLRDYLNAHNSIYLDYIQVGVRKELLIVFLG